MYLFPSFLKFIDEQKNSYEEVYLLRPKKQYRCFTERKREVGDGYNDTLAFAKISYSVGVPTYSIVHHSPEGLSLRFMVSPVCDMNGTGPSGVRAS